MSTRTRTRQPPPGAGAPPGSSAGPPPPLGSDPPPVDEGPMRRELLRQIAWLDNELGARARNWASARVTPLRGPAIQASATLERIRDELLDELRRRRS